MRGLMRDTLPPAMYEFLSPTGTSWDAPLLGGAMETPAPPPAEIFDLRHQPMTDHGDFLAQATVTGPGGVASERHFCPDQPSICWN